MIRMKNLFIVTHVLFFFLLVIWGLGIKNVFSEETNWVKPGKFIIEPPTLINLGFEWYIEGDDNHNATVDVWYRKKGEYRWKKALPLLRIQNEQSIFSFLAHKIDYVTPNLFAGSILDLEPDTQSMSASLLCRIPMASALYPP